jgi:hypothetical protein
MSRLSLWLCPQVFNIQSKDAASLREFVVFAHNLWACPLLVLGAVAMLIHVLGG